MQRRTRGQGTNLDMAFSAQKRRRPQSEQSDEQLLRDSRRAARQQQERLVKARRAEQTIAGFRR